jgi:hypothetical protein
VFNRDKYFNFCGFWNNILLKLKNKKNKYKFMVGNFKKLYIYRYDDWFKGFYKEF